MKSTSAAEINIQAVSPVFIVSCFQRVIIGLGDPGHRGRADHAANENLQVRCDAPGWAQDGEDLSPQCRRPVGAKASRKAHVARRQDVGLAWSLSPWS